MAQKIEIDKAAFFRKIGYVPHPQQVLYHESEARFRVATCGRRFGKSTMAGRDLEPKLFVPNRTYWIVGPTYDLGEKEFRVIWDDLVVKMALGKDKRIKRSYNKKQGDMKLEFPWNTNLYVRSADHPENLVGDALDWVIMSEAAKHKEDTFTRYIRPALADRRGGADFPTTPEGHNWLYYLWLLGQDITLPEYESWQFPSWANSFVYPGGYDDPEIQLLVKTMTPESFAQEIGADFKSFVGKIFPEWDSAVHVKNLNFNPNWPNYITFDWGYTNPLAAIEFQVSPNDEVYVWREHYKPYMTVSQHCEILKNRNQPPGYHLDLAFGDAADPEAAAVVSQNLVGCVTDPAAKKNWREGIDLVRSFMRDREYGQDEYGAPLERPGFYVDFSCVNTIAELDDYKAPGSVNGKNVPEFGVKMMDHAIDAIRYGLMHVFRLGAIYQLNDAMVESTAPAPVTLVAPGAPGSADFFGSPGDGGFFTSGGIF
jgi:hypothetical protein